MKLLYFNNSSQLEEYNYIKNKYELYEFNIYENDKNSKKYNINGIITKFLISNDKSDYRSKLNTFDKKIDWLISLEMKLELYNIIELCYGDNYSINKIVDSVLKQCIETNIAIDNYKLVIDNSTCILYIKLSYNIPVIVADDLIVLKYIISNLFMQYKVTVCGNNLSDVYLNRLTYNCLIDVKKNGIYKPISYDDIVHVVNILNNSDMINKNKIKYQINIDELKINKTYISIEDINQSINIYQYLHNIICDNERALYEQDKV